MNQGIMLNARCCPNTRNLSKHKLRNKQQAHKLMHKRVHIIKKAGIIEANLLINPEAHAMNFEVHISGSMIFKF